MSGLLELITCLVYFHLTHGKEIPPTIEDVYVSSLQIRTGVDDSVSCCITRDHGTATHIKSIWSPFFYLTLFPLLKYKRIQLQLDHSYASLRLEIILFSSSSLNYFCNSFSFLHGFRWGHMTESHLKGLFSVSALKSSSHSVSLCLYKSSSSSCGLFYHLYYDGYLIEYIIFFRFQVVWQLKHLYAFFFFLYLTIFVITSKYIFS